MGRNEEAPAGCEPAKANRLTATTERRNPSLALAPARGTATSRAAELRAGAARSGVAAAARDAERALLTSMTLRPEIVVHVAKLVDVADFLDRDHQAVYLALLDLGEASDGPSLRDALRRGGSSAWLADGVKIGEIIDAPGVSSWCARQHARTVADNARRRRVRAVALELADDADDSTRPIELSEALAIEALRGVP